MVMDWVRIEPWDYIVDSVATDYARKYEMVERDDIKQSLYQWFLEHPNKLNEWEAIGPKDAKNLIYRSLRNQALDYCQLWKAKSVGYEVDDLFYYTPEMIEMLLPTVLSGDLVSMPQLNLNPNTGQSAPAESGNLVTMLVEVSAGFNKLTDTDKHVIILRFGLAYEYPEIAKNMELGSDDAARMRVKRAIKRLVNKAGGYKPFKDEDDVSPAVIATEEA